MDQIEKARMLISKFEDNREPNFEYEILYKLSKALLLNSSLRFKDKVLAQEILKEIIELPDLNFNLN